MAAETQDERDAALLLNASQCSEFTQLMVMAIKLYKLCRQSVCIVLIHIIVADFVFPWKVTV